MIVAGNVAYETSDDALRTHDHPASATTGHTAATHSAALRVVETYTRSGVLGSEAADKLDAIARDEDGDPAAHGARYIEAVSRPEYRRAFHQVLRDPATAHLSMSPAELASVREVRRADEQRALGPVPLPVHQIEPVHGRACGSSLEAHRRTTGGDRKPPRMGRWPASSPATLP